MKQIITIVTFMLLTLTAGLASAYEAVKTDDKGSMIFNELLGARQEVLFETYPGDTWIVEGSKGMAAGGLRGDADKGSRIFSELLGARQEILFETSPGDTGIAEGSKGMAAGGLRGDADKGSRIYNEMLGAHEAVLFGQ